MPPGYASSFCTNSEIVVTETRQNSGGRPHAGRLGVGQLVACFVVTKTERYQQGRRGGRSKSVNGRNTLTPPKETLIGIISTDH